MPPPTLGQFTRLVRQVLDELPERFHPQMENLVIDVVDEPSAADLRGLPHRERILSGDDELFGIFHGVSPMEDGSPDEPMNQIKIFRGAHIRTCSSRRELLRQVRATVLHELAHHFGFSEDDLADFESRHAPDD
jgi:predicted Zn-dependent protease with MMP-like domain